MDLWLDLKTFTIIIMSSSRSTLFIGHVFLKAWLLMTFEISLSYNYNKWYWRIDSQKQAPCYKSLHLKLKLKEVHCQPAKWVISWSWHSLSVRLMCYYDWVCAQFGIAACLIGQPSEKCHKHVYTLPAASVSSELEQAITL